jgi:hypothetical protein
MSFCIRNAAQSLECWLTFSLCTDHLPVHCVFLSANTSLRRLRTEDWPC